MPEGMTWVLTVKGVTGEWQNRGAGSGKGEKTAGCDPPRGGQRTRLWLREYFTMSALLVKFMRFIMRDL